MVLLQCGWLTSAFNVCVSQDIGFKAKDKSLFFSRYMIFWASLNLLTFSVMVAVYARIYVYVRRKGKRMSQHSSHHLRHNETVFNLMKTISIVLGEWDLELAWNVHFQEDVMLWKLILFNNRAILFDCFYSQIISIPTYNLLIAKRYLTFFQINASL
jgi:hypothetical protein